MSGSVMTAVEVTGFEAAIDLVGVNSRDIAVLAGGTSAIQLAMLRSHEQY
jgi:hypothetical protein